jgi:cation diffusion facilitator family transporter
VLQCDPAGTLAYVSKKIRAAPHGSDHDHGHGHGPGHDHGHGPGHDHGHGPGHDHGDGRGRGTRALARRLARLHTHESATRVDRELETSAAGMRALWLSLAILAATAAVQAAVVLVSGSVGLLGDTVHNAADALTAVPLGIAFVLARRPPTRRYTYGYGRAEDLAGVVVLLAIAASCVFTGYQAVQRLIEPRGVSHLGMVALAALAGFAGNELAARCRIRTGRAIGSAALIADGMHARADGLTSLAVLAGAGGAVLGWPQADPVAGLVITAAILAAARKPAAEVWRRLMDAVEPALVDAAIAALQATPGVLGVGRVRLRWVGHWLSGECEVVVDPRATAVQAHQVAAEAEHALLHALPRLSAAIVHADPQAGSGPGHHAMLAGHRAPAGAG